MHAAEPVFDRAAIEDLELPHGLNAVATCLAEYGMPLHALPPLAMLKHLATDAACDAAHSAAADALALDALTPLGQLGHAVALLGSALAGLDLPPNAMQLPHASAAARPPMRARRRWPRRRRRRPPLAIIGPEGTHFPSGAAADRASVAASAPLAIAAPEETHLSSGPGGTRSPPAANRRAAACAARVRTSSCSCVHAYGRPRAPPGYARARARAYTYKGGRAPPEDTRARAPARQDNRAARS